MISLKISLYNYFEAYHRDYILWCNKKKFMNEKALPNKMYVPTNYEHCANTMSHAIMFIPSVIGSEMLLSKAEILKPNPIDMSSFIEQNYAQNSSLPSYTSYEFCARAYGISLVSLFFVSSVYHWICWTQSAWKKNSFSGCSIRRPSLNKVFHVCDRTTIFFYIAGSYSPWLMLRQINPDLIWLQWAVWLFAITGSAYNFLFLEKNKLLEILFYLFASIVPGALLYFYNIESNTSTDDPLLMLAAGGCFYLVGVVFFKCDGRIPFAHAIWHLFVAAGASSHSVLIYTHLYAGLK